jgi:hypothetical protein
MRRAIWLTVTAALLAGALGGVGGTTSSAGASDLDVNVDIGRAGDRYVLKGPVDLQPGEHARSVIVVRGPVTVREGATITDDLVVVDGRVLIEGTVRGRVVTLGDRATVTRTGVVGDGIRYGSDRPIVAPGAHVSGGVKKIDASLGRGSSLIPAIAWWLAMSVSTFLLGLLLLLLAPRAAEATFALMHDGGWGPALGVGFALLVGLPLLAVVALVTFVGIPFGIGLLLALVPLAALGYVTGVWVIGRAMVGPPDRRILAFLAGWAVLRVVALLPFLGALVFVVTATFGLGALAWTLLRARRADATPGSPGAQFAPPV